MARLRITKAVITGAAALALVAGGTAAVAAIAAGPVDSSGVIHGCWTNAAINGTHVFVLQDAGTSCPKGTTAISWNQAGPAGPAGPAGATGATGSAGPAGPIGPTGATGAVGPPGAQGSAGSQGAAGPAGPSTGGSSGLDLEVISGAPGTGAAVAVCPADHPYVFGGGGYDSTGSNNTTISGSALALSEPDSGVTGPEANAFGIEGGDWTVVSVNSSDTLTAYVICGK
jgi:Collagen triple helix repeat (20 copies)